MAKEVNAKARKTSSRSSIEDALDTGEKKEVKNARITFLTTSDKMAQLQNIVNQQMANYTYGTEKPTINKLLNNAVDEYLKNHPNG